MADTEKSRAAHIFYGTLALMLLRGGSVEASTNIEEALSRIEHTVKKVDSLLSDIIPVMAALAEPQKIAGTCTVEFAAYGLDDPVRFGYIKTTGGSLEETLAPDNPFKNRGVTLVELDPSTCKTRNRQRFDTFGIAEDIFQLMETIESALPGTIIVGVTADAPENAGMFQKSAGPLFVRYNMNIGGINVRDKFAFIMQKGYPKKTIFERKPRFQESIQLKVQLRGPSVSEAHFIRLL